MKQFFSATPRRLTLVAVALITLAGCEPKHSHSAAPIELTAAELAASEITAETKQAAYQPITVEHKLGNTLIEKLPQRVVALDMNEVDFLDQLNVPVAGMPKDFIPHFLAQYSNTPQITDTGAIVQPNLEKVYAAKPDLILITSLQAQHYTELSKIAPTVHFDVDYRDSRVNHIDVIKAHLLTLGLIFDKQQLAQQKAAELDAWLAQVRQLTQGRPEKALIVLHNNGAFSAFGTQSRYGFVFNALGVTPANPGIESGLHGQPVSSEFIRQANPDIIFIVDRTAVMEQRPALNAQSLINPLLRQTNAWKNNKVIFTDAEAWYTTAASVHSLKLIIDDVIKGYQ